MLLESKFKLVIYDIESAKKKISTVIIVMRQLYYEIT